MRRATVHFDADVHRALRLKSAETDRPISEFINEAVRLELAEDAEDLCGQGRRQKAELGALGGSPEVCPRPGLGALRLGLGPAWLDKRCRAAA